MTIGAHPVGNVLKTYTRVMKSRAPGRDSASGEARVEDTVTISLEGKRKQILDFAAREIIQRVKTTR